MRGTRVKRMRNDGIPHPGRKYGGQDTYPKTMSFERKGAFWRTAGVLGRVRPRGKR